MPLGDRVACRLIAELTVNDAELFVVPGRDWRALHACLSFDGVDTLQQQCFRLLEPTLALELLHGLNPLGVVASPHKSGLSRWLARCWDGVGL